MNPNRALILRLRHDSPTREMSMEAADMIEQLSRAQRRLPHSDTVMLGSMPTEAELRLPPFDGVEAAQMAERAKPKASIVMCPCFDGLCRCEVVNGRTVTGQRCKAHMQDRLEA